MGLKETWKEIEPDRLKKLIMSVLLVLGFTLTGAFWINPDLKIYIFKTWSILFLISLIVGGTVRHSKMKTREVALRFAGLLIAMFFLFGGLGVSLSIGTGTEMNLMALEVENALPEILGGLFGNFTAGMIAAFCFLGSILINHGDATGNDDEYGVGSLIITTPIVALAIMHGIGWIAPLPILMVFGAFAPYMSSAAIVVVGYFFAKIGFMFDELIRDADEGIE